MEKIHSGRKIGKCFIGFDGRCYVHAPTGCRIATRLDIALYRSLRRKLEVVIDD
jgi:hypothetical protein